MAGHRPAIFFAGIKKRDEQAWPNRAARLFATTFFMTCSLCVAELERYPAVVEPVLIFS
jgi:hypothetical protein